MDNTITLARSNRSNRTHLSRWLLFSQLDKIKHSGLTISDNDGRYFFGDEKSALQAQLTVYDPACYKHMLFGGSIGAAESYVSGKWDSPNLHQLIRLFAKNLSIINQLDSSWTFIFKPFRHLIHWMKRNTKDNSRQNISAHYDLSNELYQLMLDPYMQYSSAIYDARHQSLNQAQENKLETICRKLDLKKHQHLLEIGSGWGGLALYAAQNYGCKVTTVTLSEQQYQYVQNKIKQHQLQHNITIELKDYRDLCGSYDKVVSIEMIEAVGHQYFSQYFSQLNKLLKPGGKLLIQSITIADENLNYYRKNVDFIQKYIFPGGCLPSVSEMSRHLSEDTDMVIESIDDYALDYAQTLKHWSEKFNEQISSVKQLGFDNQFIRLWNFYLAYCEGGFREQTIGLVHLSARKPA